MSELEKAIQHEVESASVTYKGALTAEEIFEVSSDLTDFVQKAARKYAKGKLEHGGRITERDLDVEIENEIIDLFHYTKNRARQME